MHLPNGLQISLLQVDYRGFNQLPKAEYTFDRFSRQNKLTDGYSQFAVECFFAGIQGPKFQQTFVGPLSEEYFIPNTLQATSIAWSKCGADVQLRINTSMASFSNSRRDETMSTVDTHDVHVTDKVLGAFCNQPTGLPISFLAEPLKRKGLRAKVRGPFFCPGMAI